MSNLREALIRAVEKHAEGHIEKHRLNVENMLQNSVGVGEHPDIIESVEKELKIIAEYDDQLNTLKKYFK